MKNDKNIWSPKGSGCLAQEPALASRGDWREGRRILGGPMPRPGPRVSKMTLHHHQHLAIGARPEEQVLLLCARLRLTPEGFKRLRTLAQEELEWDYVLELAGRHGLIPLLHHHLGAACLEYVPQGVWDRLRSKVYRNAAWNMLLAAELLRILAVFEAAGISAIPFKGPALAALVYGDLSLRQFSDLDILVHRHDVPQARKLLCSHGYRPILSLTDAQETEFCKYYNNYEFVHDPKQILLELHWEVIRWFLSLPLDSQGMWQRLEKRLMGGQRVFNLSPEDALLVICVHSAVHCWERLAWTCDVATLIEQSPELDWNKVMDLAHKTKSERMLGLGLFLAHELLETSLPSHVGEMVQSDPAVKFLALKVRNHLFGPRDQGSRFFAETRFHLQIRANLWFKARHLFHALFSPSDEDLAFLPLPPGCFFLYYFIRPMRLIGKYLLRLESFRRVKGYDAGKMPPTRERWP